MKYRLLTRYGYVSNKKGIWQFGNILDAYVSGYFEMLSIKRKLKIKGRLEKVK